MGVWKNLTPQAACGNTDPSAQDNLGPELQGGLDRMGSDRPETVLQSTHSKVPTHQELGLSLTGLLVLVPFLLISLI